MLVFFVKGYSLKRPTVKSAKPDAEAGEPAAAAIPGAADEEKPVSQEIEARDSVETKRQSAADELPGDKADRISEKTSV